MVAEAGHGKAARGHDFQDAGRGSGAWVDREDEGHMVEGNDGLPVSKVVVVFLVGRVIVWIICVGEEGIAGMIIGVHYQHTNPVLDPSLRYTGIFLAQVLRYGCRGIVIGLRFRYLLKLIWVRLLPDAMGDAVLNKGFIKATSCGDSRGGCQTQQEGGSRGVVDWWWVIRVPVLA